MSTDRDLARIVRSWLHEDAHEDADRVLDLVLDQLDATPQRRAFWLARRLPVMNSNIVRLGVAAVAVAVAAIVGINLVRDSVGGGPEPSPTQAAEPPILTTAANLDPGTYTVGGWFPVQFDFTINDKWERWGTGAKVTRVWKPCKSGACEGYSAILSFEIVDRVFIDPCGRDPGPAIGDGVDDLVTAVTNMPAFDAGPVTDMAIDGYAAKSFELTFVGPPNDACEGSGTLQWMSGEDGVYWGTDVANQRVIVIDVDGTRLLVDAVTYHGDPLELDAIIDSIDFH